MLVDIRFHAITEEGDLIALRQVVPLQNRRRELVAQGAAPLDDAMSRCRERSMLQEDPTDLADGCPDK
jgi:hypothetical protein